MKHLIDQVEKDSLHLEIERYGDGSNYQLKLIRQYDTQEPEVKFEAYLNEKALNNLIVGLQKVSLYGTSRTSDPDSSKNFGKH
jgi:hypothetical protein